MWPGTWWYPYSAKMYPYKQHKVDAGGSKGESGQPPRGRRQHPVPGKTLLKIRSVLQNNGGLPKDNPATVLRGGRWLPLGYISESTSFQHRLTLNSPPFCHLSPGSRDFRPMTLGLVHDLFIYLIFIFVIFLLLTEILTG